MGLSLNCLDFIDVQSCINEIESVAHGVYEDKKDIADIILYERVTQSSSVVTCSFSLKIKHDNLKSQMLCEKFMQKYRKDGKFYLKKTSVLIENRTLKEIFFLEVRGKV